MQKRTAAFLVVIGLILFIAMLDKNNAFSGSATKQAFYPCNRVLTSQNPSVPDSLTLGYNKLTAETVLASGSASYDQTPYSADVFRPGQDGFLGTADDVFVEGEATRLGPQGVRLAMPNQQVPSATEEILMYRARRDVNNPSSDVVLAFRYGGADSILNNINDVIERIDLGMNPWISYDNYDVEITKQGPMAAVVYQQQGSLQTILQILFAGPSGRFSTGTSQIIPLPETSVSYIDLTENCILTVAIPNPTGMNAMKAYDLGINCRYDPDDLTQIIAQQANVGNRPVLEFTDDGSQFAYATDDGASRLPVRLGVFSTEPTRRLGPSNRNLIIWQAPQGHYIRDVAMTKLNDLAGNELGTTVVAFVVLSVTGDGPGYFKIIVDPGSDGWNTGNEVYFQDINIGNYRYLTPYLDVKHNGRGTIVLLSGDHDMSVLNVC